VQSRFQILVPPSDLLSLKKKNLYVLQKTSKMQFYIRVSVILVYVLLFHTQTEAYQGTKLVPANPSNCSSEVKPSPHVLRDIS